MGFSLLPALLLLIADNRAQLLNQFETNLAAQDSATTGLQHWCAARHIADPANIRAMPVADQNAKPPKDLRAQLGMRHGERIGYRHVRLTCGGIVLSEAHNWYVPARLTPAMNTLLEQSDTPFGKVTAALHFRREPLKAATQVCPKESISAHRALLRLPDGQPLALVIECYTAANLR